MVDKTVKTGQYITHMVIIFQRDCLVFWILWNQLCYTSSKSWRHLYWKFHTYTQCAMFEVNMDGWKAGEYVPHYPTHPTLYTVLGHHPVGAMELPCTQRIVNMCLFYLHMPVMLSLPFSVVYHLLSMNSPVNASFLFPSSYDWHSSVQIGAQLKIKSMFITFLQRQLYKNGAVPPCFN